MCKNKNRMVYGCFKAYLPTSCNKMFCFNCLFVGLKENIIFIIQKTDSWKCPFKRKICNCKSCGSKEDPNYNEKVLPDSEIC